MDNYEFIEKSRKLLAQKLGYTIDQIYVVWLVKVLGNNKAMLSTTVDGDGIYAEVTYNGNKKETYLDIYNKRRNFCIKD